MSPDLLTNLTGGLSTALALAFAVPQWSHVRRTGSVAGVSLPSQLNSLVSTTAWLLYGLHLSDVWVTATSVAGFPALLATVAVVMRHRATSWAGTWVSALWASLLLACAAVSTWIPALFATVLGCSVLWYVAPAARQAWRSADVSGVAAGTWLLLGLDGLVAGAYGLLAGVTASVVYCLVALTGAGVVLARFAGRWQPDCGVCAPVPGCACPV